MDLINQGVQRTVKRFRNKLRKQLTLSKGSCFLSWHSRWTIARLTTFCSSQLTVYLQPLYLDHRVHLEDL